MSGTMYKEASQLALRFETSKGNCSVEDLWDLPLTSERGPCLDYIAIDLSVEVEGARKKSFVTDVTAVNKEQQLRFDIVRDVITTKLAERAAKKSKAAQIAQREKIKEIIANKQDDALSNKTIEELNAILDGETPEVAETGVGNANPST